jgi:hypothetical protein
MQCLAIFEKRPVGACSTKAPPYAVRDHAPTRPRIFLGRSLDLVYQYTDGLSPCATVVCSLDLMRFVSRGR